MDTELVRCPYCGEELEVAVDWSVPRQEYIEDCHVCCQPMSLLVTVVGTADGGYEATVSARTGDD